MPDALSKTISIWCCVLNNLLFPQSSSADLNSTTTTRSEGVSGDFESQSHIYHPLETPPNIISQTEHSQILAKIPILIRQARSLCLDLPYLRTALKNRPLRPCFTTSDRHVSPSAPTQLIQDETWDSHIILCCSVSHHTTSPFEGYIQGAGDDSENWAHGLTPQSFWNRKDELMQAADKGEWALVEAIKKLVADEQKGIRTLGPGQERDPIMPARLGKMKLFVGPTPSTGGVLHGFDIVIVCADTRPSDDAIIHNLQQQTDPWTKILRLPCGKGKPGSRALRAQLPRLIPFIDSFDLCISRILVACDTDGDLSLGVALALSCLYFDNRGFMRSRRGGEIDKDMINSRLMGIMGSMVAMHKASKPRPAKFSRATLQSVKAFLMPRKPGGGNSREDSDED
ncbi:MAG: tRNA A64-2'-O-ribosylphosphate transferase [Ramalina farinacea]|uniref:tRNA A64-2'-O-ribosylphosphate transferase n=1 Tax=Ramalina farinacea TaxID=258253 RepID=A0AA43U0Q1_9LECA|nr:tRNA A64-2'-O-ribosylphosphate transferase [Ramalina farinacea]